MAALKLKDIPKRIVKDPLMIYSGIKGMFHQTKDRVGLPPGQAIYTGTYHDEPYNISYFQYSDHHLDEHKNQQLDDVKKLAHADDFVWINFQGIHHAEQVRELCEAFNIHSLTIEDILSVEQRPKIEETENYVFVVCKMLLHNSKTRKNSSEQVSLILGENFVISFQEIEGDTFDPVRERLRAGKGRIRKEGSDYLLYALLDTIVDHYFVILEKIGDVLEDIEGEIMLKGKKDSFDRLYALRREMIHIRRSVWPLREVVSKMERDDMKLIKKNTRIYIRDVYDHTIQAIDSVETYRDFISSLGDLYQSVISNRMNAVMKTLTIISVIFIPLTFVAGVYGMNFDYIPELKWDYGYAYFWGLIVSLLTGTLVLFRVKNWL